MAEAINPTRTTHARRVVRLVHEGAADTRQGIAEVTGMSASLVSRVTGDLIRTGVLEARPEGVGDRRGRPIERLTIRADAGRTIGVEVARDRLTFVTCDAHGDVVDTWTAEREHPEVSERALASVADRIATSGGETKTPLWGVGVALHDVVTADGDWLRADVRAAGIPARRILSERLGVPVVIEDVSRAFADAEHRFGAGRDAPDMLYLFLGRDAVGSGIFAGDVPIRSSSGICGEIGHVRVVQDGRRCSCGNRGCLETVATQEAVLQSARTYLEQGVHSELMYDAGMDEFLLAARNADKVATLVLHDLASHLCISLTGAISVTGATTVVLGGDVRTSGPSLPTLLAEELRRTLLQPLATRVEVRWAALPPHAGAHGVAYAALESAVESGVVAGEHVERRAVM